MTTRYLSYATDSSMIPQSKLVVLKDCGHYPYIEQLEAFFEEVRKFMDSNGSAM